MSIILNPIIVGVVVLIVLCLVKVNVTIALMVSSICAGLVAGISPVDTVNLIIEGMPGNASTALSYVLLGFLAAAMAYTGITEILSHKLSKLIGSRIMTKVFRSQKMVLLVSLAIIACFSQNAIPVHIAFIPLLIPAMLPLMNELKIDRRAVACSLSFGLEAPYIALPFGFGYIFQGILADNLKENGMSIAQDDVWHYTWQIGAFMILGLVASWIFFRKPREYKEVKGFEYVEMSPQELKMTYKHWVTIIAALVTLIVNVKYDSLVLGALCGIIVMVVFGAIKLSEMVEINGKGLALMADIAVIMLVAAGFANVMKSTGAVNELVEASVGVIGSSKILAAVMMMIIGLVITLGIGSSFGTIPVLAVLYVPLCASLGFSVGGTTMIIAAAAALGDAGSPASDTALGPTSGLNVDGQHSHIWDTCVPTAICYNVPIALCAILIAPII